MRRLIRLLGPDEFSLAGGDTGGVIPNIIVTGDALTLRDRRRCLAAERSDGYHTEEERANVGKSRMYINLGRVLPSMLGA